MLTKADVPWATFHVDGGKDKILNERTGHYVLVSGPRGQEILAKLKKAGPKIAVDAVPWAASLLNEDKTTIKNVTTGKYVDVNGPTGQGILKQMLTDGPPTDEDIPYDVMKLVSLHVKDPKTLASLRMSSKVMNEMIPHNEFLKTRLSKNLEFFKKVIEYADTPHILYFYTRDDNRRPVMSGALYTSYNRAENYMLLLKKNSDELSSRRLRLSSLYENPKFLNLMMYLSDNSLHHHATSGHIYGTICSWRTYLKENPIK